MNVRSFLVILILSVITTYGAAITNDLIKGSLVGGKGGIPLPFASGSSTDGFMLTLDIIFWFLVILIAWKILLRISKR